MRREFFILANVNETQRYAKWNERTPEGKRRKQMAQVNLEIVWQRLPGRNSGMTLLFSEGHAVFLMQRLFPQLFSSR